MALRWAIALFWPWCAKLYFTCIFKHIFEIVCELCILFRPWNEASQGMQSGEKTEQTEEEEDPNTDTFIGSLVSYLVQKGETFKFHPWNRRKEHLFKQVMIFLLPPKTWISQLCLRDSEMKPGVDLISIDCSTLSCFMLQAALKSPSQPSQCWVQDTKGSRMLQSLFLSLSMLASSPPFLRHQRQLVALPWTCFSREFYLLTLYTIWQTLKLVNNILP